MDQTKTNRVTTHILGKIIKISTRMKHDQRQHRKCSMEKLLLKNSRYSQENICVGVSLRPATLFKKRLHHRYCKIFKNICFEEYLRTGASGGSCQFFKWDFVLHDKISNKKSFLLFSEKLLPFYLGWYSSLWEPERTIPILDLTGYSISYGWINRRKIMVILYN